MWRAGSHAYQRTTVGTGVGPESALEIEGRVVLVSMDDLNEALKIFEANPSAAFFVGEKSPELVEKAELALGVRFPPSYREFVSKLGCGGIGSLEIYGITSDNFENARVPNGIWLTLEERRSIGLPDHLILIYSLGEGTTYALDTSQRGEDGECPVVAWPVGGSSDSRLEVIAKDFGEFLLSMVREELSDF